MCNEVDAMREESIRSILLTELSFRIPSVQRGLVWNPGQVMDLWDSLAKGYPIGSLLAYEGEDGRLNLLDGQQRYNAICMGRGEQMAEVDEPCEANVWVRPEGAEAPVFMVCTACHPWGFTEDTHAALSAEEQVAANEAFLKHPEPRCLDELFCKAKLAAGYPWAWRDNDCVPLPLLLRHTSVEEVLKAWRGGTYGRAWEEPRESLKQSIAAMLASDWLSRIKATRVPVLMWENGKGKEQRDMEELFSRFNKGGTTLSTIDQSYSSLCAYYDDIDLKGKNSELAEDFLPPEHLASLAGGLAVMARKDAPRWSSGVPSTEVREWRRTDSEENQIFLRLYGRRRQAGELVSVLNRFKTLCQEQEIPSPIYYMQHRHWLVTMLWTMWQFPRFFDTGDAVKLHFPLFCMLPQMFVGDTAKNDKTLVAFSKQFYEALNVSSIKEMLPQDGCSLLSLMALGTAFAAGDTLCCMYPYPVELCRDSDSTLPRIDKASMETNSWKKIFLKYRGTHESPFLYYYQKTYMKLMMEQSGFNPGMRSHWKSSGVNNRPWDIDHIIPRSWWNKKEDDKTHHPGNMQLLYFRKNRSKGNHAIRVNESIAEKKFDYAKICLRAGADGMTARDEPPWPDFSNYGTTEDGIYPRCNHIVSTLLRELRISALIAEINAIPKNAMKYNLPPTHRLSQNIRRFEFMKSLKKRMPELQWGRLEFAWSPQKAHLEELYAVPLYETENNVELDFYHSLTSGWLYAGIPYAPEKGREGLYYVCVEINRENMCFCGVLRGMGVTLKEWKDFHKSRGADEPDAWWVFLPAVKEFHPFSADENPEREIEDYLNELLASLDAEKEGREESL